MVFLNVIVSLRIKKDKRITNTGLTVITIEALIGVVKFNPSKNNNWLMAIPNKEQKDKFNNIFFQFFL